MSEQNTPADCPSCDPPSPPFRGGAGGRYKVRVERSEYRDIEVDLPVGVTWSEYLAAIEDALGIESLRGSGWMVGESRPL